MRSSILHGSLQDRLPERICTLRAPGPHSLRNPGREMTERMTKRKSNFRNASGSLFMYSVFSLSPSFSLAGSGGGFLCRSFHCGCVRSAYGARLTLLGRVYEASWGSKLNTRRKSRRYRRLPRPSVQPRSPEYDTFAAARFFHCLWRQ